MKQTTTIERPAVGPRRARSGGGLRLRIGVDFDGVLFDHIPWILRAFRDHHGVELAQSAMSNWDIARWQEVEASGITPECVRKVLAVVETDPYVHEAPLKDRYAREVIQRWREYGHEVHIVTARHPRSIDVTQDFLRRNRIDYDGFHMGVELKTGYDVLIDDAPHNVLATGENGDFALVMDQPYNRHVKTREGLRRVHDWMDVEHEVLAALLPETVSEHPRGSEPTLTYN